MSRIQQRGTDKRIKDGLKNDWKWDWLDRERDRRRIGDVLEGREKRSVGLCRVCKVESESTKVAQLGSRGFVANHEHVDRKRQQRKVLALANGTTILGEFRN